MTPLAFIASASHRQQSTLRKRFSCADVLIASLIRLGHIEYHSAVTWSVRVTAAGRSALRDQRAAAGRSELRRLRAAAERRAA